MADDGWDFGPPPEPKKKTRGVMDRLQDAYLSGALHSPIGAEGLVRLFPRVFTGKDMTGEDLNKVERNLSDELSARQAADPAVQGSFRTHGAENLGRAAVDLLGGLLGGADPTYVLGPGKSALQRIGAQGAINAGVDAGSQGIEIHRGVRDKFDPDEVAMNAAAGLVLQGAHEGARGAKSARDIRAGASHPNYNALLDAVIHLEGGGSLEHPKTSPKGAKGPMQVMDATAMKPGFGIRPWDGKSEADRARVGRQYLAALTNKYGGDKAKVLAAYNAGPGRVDAAVKKYSDEWAEHIPPETQKYVFNGVRHLGDTPDYMGDHLEDGPAFVDHGEVNDNHGFNLNLADLEDSLPPFERYKELYGKDVGPWTRKAIEDIANETGEDVSTVADAHLFGDDEHPLHKAVKERRDTLINSVDDETLPPEAKKWYADLPTRAKNNLTPDEIRQKWPDFDTDEIIRQAKEDPSNRFRIGDQIYQLVGHNISEFPRKGEPDWTDPTIFNDEGPSLMDAYDDPRSDHYVPDELPENVTDLSQVRYDRSLKEDMAHIDNWDAIASNFLDSVKRFDDEVSFEDVQAVRDQLAQMTNEVFPSDPQWARLHDIDDKLIEAQKYLRDPVVKVTPTDSSHEKFTGYPEAKTPANDPYGKGMHDYSDEEWARLSLDEKQAASNFDSRRKIREFRPALPSPEAVQEAKRRGAKSLDDLTPEQWKALEEELASKKEKPKTFIDSFIEMMKDDSGTLNMGGDEPEAFKKLREALRGARTIRRDQEKLTHAARSERIRSALDTRRVTSGEAGYYAELSKLKGEMPKANFESIRKDFTQEDLDSLFDHIKNSPRLDIYEQLRARSGLLKMLGQQGESFGTVPTKSEIALLAQVFPSDILDNLTRHREFAKSLSDHIGNALNIPRALLSTLDLSAPFRQGVVLIGRKEFWKSFAAMFKQYGSEDAFKAVRDEIFNRPTYKLMKEARLSLTGADHVLSEREEAFMSDWAEKLFDQPKKLPGVGKYIPNPVRASNRAYIGFLNKLRADTFDTLVKQAREAGIDFNDRPKALRDIGRFINNATGRGSLGRFNQAVPVLNGLFFSPRLMAGRINMLRPDVYVRLDPFVRKKAIGSMLSFAGIAMTVLGLAKAGGAEVETDPRSADFAKIKIGNTRFDVLGGFQQYIRLFARVITNKSKNADGSVTELGKGYGKPTAKDVVEQFFENKASPIAGLIRDLLDRKDATGQPITTEKEIGNLFVPLITQDIYDAYKEHGVKGLLAGIPAAFGVGVQTYQPYKAKAKKKADPDWNFDKDESNKKDKEWDF
jgi:hypothetical protein